MKTDPIYLDYAATTPLRAEVRAALEPFLGAEFGNPSSLHSYGRAARVAIEDARRRLLKLLGREGDQLIFTGSGSEADNLALWGFARRHQDGCLIHSSIEHKAVIVAARALAETGYDVRVAPVDARGVVDLAKLRELLPADGRPCLAAVMWVNNETGAVQPIRAIAELCRERGARLFSDAVQAFGKIPLDARDGVDLLSIAAHKIGGPKGVGALRVRQGVRLAPLIHGGGQESGLRAGTQNVPGIVGLAEAAALITEQQPEESVRLRALRDLLEDGLTQALPEIVVNAQEAPERAPHVLNVSLPGIDLEGTLTSLDLEGICVSSGSACTTGSVEPSHVMVAMGREGELAGNTIRFSLGWGTREADIEYVLQMFPKIVERVRAYS